jgi:uncharacterized membrane protein
MKQRATAIAVVAFLGMIDAGYLTIMRGSHVPCSLSGGCNEVLGSLYAVVAGVPLSMIGLAFYLTVFSISVLAVFEVATPAILVRWIFWLALPGFVITLGLLYLQAFVIHHFCQYCLASAAFVTTIFLLSAWPIRTAQNQQ